MTVHAIVVAVATKIAPQIFEQKYKDNSKFQCSDAFVRKLLHETLHWLERRVTRAAQKIPENWEDLCEQAVLRIALAIKEKNIPPKLIVNSNQTQVLLAQGCNLMWAETGLSQVSMVGAEEKHTFTILASVACSGCLLPFQAIWQGYTNRTCPKESVSFYKECKSAGIHFKFSDSDTYWSNQKTMYLFVNHILAPYFDNQKISLFLLASQ